MSEVKHTPGPWCLGNPRIIDQLEVRQGITAGGSWHNGEPIVVDLCQFKTNHEFPRMESNARLISAAPELLEALKRAAQGLRNQVEFGIVPDSYKCECSDIAADFESIIAKAEGRS